MSKPIDHFRHCPACGHPLQAPPLPNALRCSACDFLYFFNPTVATGVILSRPDGAVLFIRRAKEPAKGLLALPGGFIEIGETAETGLRREILEEVGLTIGGIEYLCSAVNAYEYRSVTYPVLDLFFMAEVEETIKPEPLEDVAEICWLDPARVEPAQLAFPSLRAAVRQYLDCVSRRGEASAARAPVAAPPIHPERPADNRIEE
jgi:ADP-ribose pyrophosphatase YjhB (NUDIX family)